MNILKRSLSLLLVAIMLCNMMPLTVLAEEVTPESESSVQGNLTEQPEEGDQEPQESQNEVEPEQPEEEKQEEKNDEPVVEEPSAVEVVQGMINALVIPNTDDYDSAAKYEAALAELEAQLKAIDEAVKNLTEEELAQLNADKYSSAWYAINAYYVGKIPALIAVSGTGTEADPYVYEAVNGAISKTALYAALEADFGKPYEGTVTKGFRVGYISLGNAGTTIATASEAGDFNYTPNTTLRVDIAKKGYTAAGTWDNKKGYIKIVTAYNISFSVNGKPEGIADPSLSGTVSPSGNYYVPGDVVINVPTAGEDYNVAVTFNGNPVEAVDGVYKIAAAAGTVAVTYSPVNAETFDVTLEVKGQGAAKLNGEDVLDVPANTPVTVTTTPNEGTDSVKYYVESIAVNGTVISGNTFTVEGDTKVVVTFATVTLNEKETISNLYFNKSASDWDISTLKTDVLDAVLESGYNAEDYKVEIAATLLGQTVKVDVTDDGLGRPEAIAAALKLGASNFTITKLATDTVPAVSKDYTLTVKDSRPQIEITVPELVEIAKKAEPENLKETIKSQITIKAIMDESIEGAFTMVQVDDSFIDWGGLAWPADGQDATFTVTVEVETDEVNRGDKATFSVKLTDTTTLYTVTYLDGYNTENNVVAKYTIAEGMGIQKPENPTRTYYDFDGWDVEPSGVVNDNLTFTATWVPTNDDNKNGEPDELDTFTVKFMDGEKELHSVSGLKAGDPTPEYDPVESQIPLNKKFSNWQGYADTIAAAQAAEGTCDIVYQVVWTDADKYTVKFLVEGQQYGEAQNLFLNELATKPAEDPTRVNYIFNGWYAEGAAEAYKFETPVEGDLTLTAKWLEDFNGNGIDDATEDHFTITYDVDGVKTVFENVLVGTATPAYGEKDPAKEGSIFDGWDHDVAETVTADATYVAQWLTDTNGNGVDDTKETITFAITGNGKVTIGLKEYADQDTYLYDSTKAEEITVLANPDASLSGTKYISSSYVSSISLDGTAAELTYGTGYIVTYKFTPNGSQTVEIVFTDAGFVYNEERLLNFYPGMPGVVLDDVYNTIVDTPDLPGDYTLEYFARPATSHTVNLGNLGLPDQLMSALKLIGYETITIDMPDLWLKVEVNDLTDEIENSVSLEQACAQNLTYDKIVGLWDVYNNNGGLLSGGISAVRTEIEGMIAAVTQAAYYYGAHSFGYNSNPDSDTVTEKIKVTYGNSAMYIEGETTIDLKDLRAPSYVKGSNVSVIYRDYTDEDLAALIGAYAADAEGNAIEGAVVTAVDITDPNTYEGKAASDTAYTLKFRFGGNETHKPSEADFTVQINKASASIDIPNTTVTYGQAYSMLDPSYLTLGNKYGNASEVTESMIQFVLGLDVAELDVDADGVKGLNGRLQLMLPEELQSVLDGILGITGGNVEEGVDLSLAELLKYLEPIGDSSLGALKEVLNAITSITEAGNLTITLGGALPKDIGAYLYGAVSTASNYTTAFDVAYIVIIPNATQVYLDWNYTETNGVFTYDLLKTVDLGASAFADAAFTTKHDEATAQVNNLIFGVTASINTETKEPVFDVKLALYPAGSDAETIEQDLTNGVYTQLAFLAEFGNELNYAVPIARAFLLVPDTADVEIADAADTNKAVFDNEAQTLDVSVSLNGAELDKQYLTVYYSGVQTNTQTYHSTTAPTHAGAYVVSAVYLQKDGENIVAMGADVEPLVIEPAASTVEVADKTVEVKAGTTYPVADMISAQSAVAGVNPDVTVITANVSVSLDGTSISGGLNMDLPKWVDELLKEKNLLQDKNLDVEDMLNGLERLEKATAELGVDVQIVEGLKSLLADMPAEMKITMNDNVAPEEAGVYLVAAVVTDSDHYPSLDAGLLIIKPQHEQVTLDWNFVDSNDNDIFLLETVKKMDMGAHAVEDATLDPTELFLGVDTNNWKILLTQDKTKLTLGTYTEVAFLLTGDGQKISMAAPISRTFLIVPGTADVTFVDENGTENNDRLYTYDGKSHGIGKVLFDGKELTDNCTLHLVYTGVDMLGNLYNSETAPVNAGAYTATAIVTEVDENGTYLRGGAATGALVIQQADLALDMKDTEVTYDGKEHFVDVTSNDKTADYLTIIVDKQANIVNIVLEDDAMILGTALKAKLEEALGKTLDNEFDFTQFQTALHKVIDGIEAIQIPAEVKAIISKLPPKMQEVLKQQEQEFENRKAELDAVLAAIQKEIPLSGKVVFNGQLPVNAGTYQFYGVALSANYHPEATQGILTIKPAEVTVTMNDVTVAVGDALPATWTYAVDPAAQEAVVLVENAATTAKDTAAAGIYDITATAASTDSNYAVTLIPGKLTVVAITASKDSVELEVGASETVVITTSQAGAKVTGAASADETVATVTVDQNGNVVITAVGAGTTEITVTITAEDGTELTKTISVTVKAPLYPVNNLTPNGQVEINGKTYPVDENGIAWISEEDFEELNKQTHVIATSYTYTSSGSVDPLDPQNTKGHQTYGTSMTVWYLVKNSDGSYTATEITELADFLTYQGTSIRWSSNMNMKNGIRVFTALSEAEREKLINGLLISHPALQGAKLIEYGTIITSKDKNETLVYGGTDVFASYAFRSAINEDRIFSKMNGSISYTGSFVELNEETAKKELLIRPYMILQLPGGEKITVHGAILQRSVAYVAYQNYAANSYAPGTAAYEFILNLIKDEYSSFLQ